MYRKCAIIASGSAVIAVVCLNSTCYGGGGKNNVTAYAKIGQAMAADDAAEELEEENEIPVSVLAAVSTVPVVSAEQEYTPAPLMAYLTERILSEHGNAEEEEEEKEDEAVPVNAGYINPIITITEEDYDNLVRIVEAEATDLDVKAKILVANVVINRVFSKDFPDNVSDVIFQGDGAQFQPVRDGRFYSVEINESSYEAVDRALVGEDYSEGALFFAATASAGEGSWFALNLNRLFEYEGHVFFTFK